MVYFQTKNANLGKFWTDLCIMENVGIFYGYFGIFYGYLVYFIVFWQCFGNLVYFSPFWYIVSRKIWQP
jgi:hypothetical protein